MKYRLSVRVIASDPGRDSDSQQFFDRFAEARRVYRRTLLQLYRKRGLRKWAISLNYSESPPWEAPICSDSEIRPKKNPRTGK